MIAKSLVRTALGRYVVVRVVFMRCPILTSLTADCLVLATTIISLTVPADRFGSVFTIGVFIRLLCIEGVAVFPARLSLVGITPDSMARVVGVTAVVMIANSLVGVSLRRTTVSMRRLFIPSLTSLTGDCLVLATTIISFSVPAYRFVAIRTFGVAVFPALVRVGGITPEPPVRVRGVTAVVMVISPFARFVIAVPVRRLFIPSLTSPAGHRFVLATAIISLPVPANLFVALWLLIYATRSVFLQHLPLLAVGFVPSATSVSCLVPFRASSPTPTTRPPRAPRAPPRAPPQPPPRRSPRPRAPPQPPPRRQP